MKSPFAMDLTGQHSAVPVSPLSRARGQSSEDHASVETTDLRKRPIYEDRASLLAYVPTTDVRKHSTALPIGTQASFIAAADAAARAEYPLNTLLTIRWDSLGIALDGRSLAALSVVVGIAKLVESLRKWLSARGIPPLYIWVREAKDVGGDHWHCGFHLPKEHRRVLIPHVAKLTGEVASTRVRHLNRTEGEFAVGEDSNWHLAEDTHPERQGYFLAAYLGKGEPSQRLFRGKLRNNMAKPVRGIQFGGDRLGNRYDSDQGLVIGTATREARFHISKPLRDAMPKQKPAGRTTRNPKREGK